MAPFDPPPEAVYDSIEVAEAHIQQWAEAHGYATVRKNSFKNTYGEIRKIWIVCDKGDKIRSVKSFVSVSASASASDEQQQSHAKLQTKFRKAESRKIECEFTFTIIRNSEKQ